ncbi:hypothetical protein QAD02_000161 [Eretmocerus hayati]|uniref:Uncharacterized protein n=1 Tax=Eretmocerus hayati TaxID=131215 RepID=A0ACC2NCX8_9HYME|nr:hypothetical protein QAD02_000161 [Eretmocerus hayati]
MTAAKSNDIRIVQQLIHGVGATRVKRDVCATDSLGNTCLHYAVLGGSSEMVRLLLFIGALPDCKNSLKATPLTRAVMLGKKDIVQQLIEAGAKVNLRDPKGWTCLHCAVLNEDSDLVRFLLSAGAKPNHQNVKGEPPLHLAIRSGRTDFVQLLIDAGAEVYYYNNKASYYDLPRTPFHVAIDKCNVEMLNLLLDNVGDLMKNRPKHIDQTVESSVLCAAARARCNKIPILKALLDHGANIHMVEFFFQFARENNLEVVTFFLERGYRTYQMLQDYCANTLCAAVNACDEYLNNCNHSTGKCSRDTRMLTLLLDYFKKESCVRYKIQIPRDEASWTPIHEAAFRGKSEHLKVLLQAGADSNIATNSDTTPLECIFSDTSCGDEEWVRVTSGGWRLYRFGYRLVREAPDSGKETLGNSTYKYSGRLLMKNKIDREGPVISKYFPLEDWEQSGESTVDWALTLTKKIFWVIKQSILQESKCSIEYPINEIIEDFDPAVRKYYEDCRVEMNFLQNHQFDEPITCYDIIAKEDFYERVSSLEGFENLRFEFHNDKISQSILIYANDLDYYWCRAYEKYKEWDMVVKGLERILGFHKNSFHLIFPNILDRLTKLDLCNLGEMERIFIKTHQTAKA